jgi:short-subunit dehydrogenase
LQAAADSLRAEVAKDGVQVTVICPGYVKTNLSHSAVTSRGTMYGKMDESTSTGDSPDEISSKIIQAILTGEKEVLLCSLVPRVAMFLRYVCPALYFRIMERRAAKGVPEVED